MVQCRFVATKQNVLEQTALRRALLHLTHQIVLHLDGAPKDLEARGQARAGGLSAVGTIDIVGGQRRPSLGFSIFQGTF